MQLKKITEYGKKGYFYVGKTEIFTISWDNGKNPIFFCFGKDRRVKKISKDYFARETIGSHYKTIENQLPLDIESYRITEDPSDNRYLCSHQEGIIYGFDNTGKKFFEWEADEIGQGHSIYDIKYQEDNFLWLAFPGGQTVTQVSLKTKKETHRIGNYLWDDKFEYLSYPESISISNNTLYIPNMGNNKLLRLSLETLQLELFYIFEEKLWQYEQTPLGIFIITDSGIYEIENE